MSVPIVPAKLIQVVGIQRQDGHPLLYGLDANGRLWMTTAGATAPSWAPVTTPVDQAKIPEGENWQWTKVT
jgi:hypothetical protein